MSRKRKSTTSVGISTTTRNRRKQQSITLDHLVELQPLTSNQEKLFDAYDKGKFIVAHGYPGTGKAQPLYSKVLTPLGWKLMGDLKIGDEIVTPSGRTSKIIGVFPQGEKEIYEIIFHDGSKTRACNEHLWECYFPNDKNYRQGSTKKVVTTKDIIKHLEYQKIKKSKDNVNISIDIIEPRETPNIDLPLDPYLLGVILGDGSTAVLPIRISNMDQELIEKISTIISENFNGCYLNKVKSSKYDHSIIIDRTINKNNPVSKIIKELNLYGKKSYEKTIPDIYFRASIEQKIKLLQGLFDTDGTVDTRGCVSYTTTSEIMAKQVQELIWSIGGVATITERVCSFTHKGIKKQGRKSYTIFLKIKDKKNLFSLSRKKDRCSLDCDPLQYRRRIKEVNYIGNEEAQCIMIDDEDHLYITDDYIVTHNTFITLYKALEEVLDPTTPYEKVIVVRSIVPTRDIGFLKGSVDEKQSEYEKPYKYMIKNLFTVNTEEEYELLYGLLKAQKSFYFMSTSFIRGMTFDNCIIIVDELENLSGHELASIITRIGQNCKMHFAGDIEQSDLTKISEKNGAADFLRVLRAMDEFEFIDFQIDDIVRSGIVKNFIIKRNELGITL
jgi:phosphate starvation-inducible protein PhoH